jgi:hypothetical protein
MRYLPCLPIIASLLAAPALARPDSLEGKWRFDPKQSELLPGEPPPADLIMNITKDDGTSFQWTVTVTMPDGQGGSTAFKGAIDGKAYPIQGRPGSTSAFSWTEDGSLKQVSEGPGGIATETCTFPPGGKRFVCEARQTDMTGRSVTYVETFDRVPPAR